MNEFNESASETLSFLSTPFVKASLSILLLTYIPHMVPQNHKLEGWLTNELVRIIVVFLFVFASTEDLLLSAIVTVVLYVVVWGLKSIDEGFMSEEPSIDGVPSGYFPCDPSKYMTLYNDNEINQQVVESNIANQMVPTVSESHNLNPEPVNNMDGMYDNTFQYQTCGSAQHPWSGGLNEVMGPRQ